MLTAAGVVLLVLLATAALVPLSISLLRHLNTFDIPKERSSHTSPTLRGGGFAPAFVALSFIGFVPALEPHARISMLLAGGLFAVLGLADDLRDVSPLPRFLGQLIVAALTLPWVLAKLDFPPAVTGALGVLGVLWLVSYVNAFNFMDGINGISAAQAVGAGGVFAIAAVWAGNATLALLSGTVAAAALGFLPFNFPRARIFLGDVGSYFFGATLALLVLLALRAGFTLEAALAPLALYLADTGTTLARRIWKGKSWHQPHRDHVYQRLVKLGWSHTKVTATVFAAILACALPGALTLAFPAARPFAVAAIALVLWLYLLSPRIIARRDAAAS